MALPYTKVNFVDGTTPLNAATLSKLDQGIKDLDDARIAGGGGIPATLIDAKGDLIAGSAPDTAARLGVGSTGQVLTADPAQALGIKWATPSGGSGSIPIQLLNPWVSADIGNSYWSVSALGVFDFGYWVFVRDVEGIIAGQVRVPAGATGGTIRLALAAAATAGITRMSLQTKAIADGESYTVAAPASAAAQDITVPATAMLRKDVLFTVPEVLAGGDNLLVAIKHEGNHANDTLAANTLLLGAWLEPT